MAKIHFKTYTPNQLVLFPQRIDEDIAENDPVRIVNTIVDSLNLESFKKLYKEKGRSPYHPRMMLKVILYAYMTTSAPAVGWRSYSCVTSSTLGWPVMRSLTS